VKVTLIVQLESAASEPPQVVADSAKSPGFVPVKLMPEIVKVVFRLFFILTIFAVLVVPTVVARNFSLAGVTVTCGPPVPDIEITCGLLLALSVITRLADSAPIKLAVNLTLTVQDFPIARVAPQVVVLEKSPALVPPMAIDEKFTTPPALFVKVTLLAALVTPSGSLANTSEVGVNVSGPMPPPPTVIAALPTIALLMVSVAVMVWLPDVFKVAVKVCVP
jgi:hypothetical protein